MDAMTPPEMLAPMQGQMAQALQTAPKPTTHDVLRRKAENQRRYRTNNREKYLELHREEMRIWRAENPDKSNEQARNYRKRHPDAVRSANLKKTYGITLAQFTDMFRAQGSVCAICKSDTAAGKNWHVDHCHETKKIRGILCHPWQTS